MAKSSPIPYKDTLAMPGSELHRFLSENNLKAAEKSYQATEERYRALMGVPEKTYIKREAMDKFVKRNLEEAYPPAAVRAEYEEGWAAAQAGIPLDATWSEDRKNGFIEYGISQVLQK